MGILQYPTPIPATVGTLPSLKFMVTTDNLATVTTAGYLNSGNVDSANPISTTDVLMVLYSYNYQTTSGTFAQFTVSISGVTGAISLIEWINPGNVLLPVISGDLAVFNGTTGQIKDSGITAASIATAIKTQTAIVTLTAAQVLAMYATPALIVAAPPTGMAIIPTACQIITLVSTAFAGGGTAQLQWGNTIHAGGTVALDATTPAAEITAAASQIYTQYGVPTTTVTPIATANGLGLYFTNATGPFTGGAGSTVTVAVTYMTVPV